MIDFRVTIFFCVTLCLALFVGSVARGASITGDEFTATLSENGVILGTTNGVAGMVGDDAVPIDELGVSASIDWLDDDTFELDFFGVGSLVTWSLTGLDLTEAGSPVDIIGVSEFQADFGWSYTASVGADSITIVYPSLTGIAIGDGEVISFDVLTAPIPEPSALLLLLTAAGGLLIAGRSSSRR